MVMPMDQNSLMAILTEEYNDPVNGSVFHVAHHLAKGRAIGILAAVAPVGVYLVRLPLQLIAAELDLALDRNAVRPVHGLPCIDGIHFRPSAYLTNTSNSLSLMPRRRAVLSSSGSCGTRFSTCISLFLPGTARVLLSYVKPISFTASPPVTLPLYAPKARSQK